MSQKPKPEALSPVMLGYLALFLGGFIVVALLSFGGIFMVNQAGGPWWMQALAFFVPGVLFSIALNWFGRPFLTAMQRAAPSKESQALLEDSAEEEALVEEDPLQEDTVDSPKDDHLRRQFYALPTVSTTVRESGQHLLERDNLSPGCSLLGVFGIAVFWNGIVSVSLYQAIFGNGGWWLRIFLIPFVLVGLMLLANFFYSLLVFFVNQLVGKVEVLLGRHPIAPGQTVDVFVQQSGPFALNRIGVRLVCIESATYTQGTSTSTATKTVYEEEAEEQSGSFQVKIPLEAMHSFQSSNNGIKWRLEVSGKVLGLLPFSEGYAFLVKPQEQLR